MNALTRKSFQLAAGLCYKALRLDIFSDHRWLMSTSSWSPEERRNWRLHKLNYILEFAWTHVSFYRDYWGDHGITFVPLKEIEELDQYPILTKDVFKKNAPRIRPDNLDAIRHIPKATGGTTGRPVKYLRDLEQWTFSEAFHLWGWSQLGYVFGDPIGVIAGGSLVPERVTISGRVRNFLHRRLFLYGLAMDEAIAHQFYHRLKKHRVKFLYGYPSVIYLFARHLNKIALTLPDLKAVVTTAEMLLPQYRHGIEECFGVPVYDNLGGNDGGYESYECAQHKGLHYNDLQSILQVTSTGEDNKGNLLITNLWNKSTPFIRYEIGDIVKLSNERCPCGCPFPMISSIDGRTADILTFGDGKSISGPALTLIFGEMEIDGWQVVKRGPYRLEVRICCLSQIKQEYINHILRVLRHYLSDDIEIVIKRVDELEITRGGKRKPIWSDEEGM